MKCIVQEKLDSLSQFDSNPPVSFALVWKNNVSIFMDPELQFLFSPVLDSLLKLEKKGRRSTKKEGTSDSVHPLITYVYTHNCSWLIIFTDMGNEITKTVEVSFWSFID